MYKFLVFSVLWTASHSANVEWFNGRWLPTVMFSNQFTKKTVDTITWTETFNSYNDTISLWTGWFLEREACGWLGMASTNQQCTCDDRVVPLVTVQDFGDLSIHQFYEFRMNEPRPVIVVDHPEEIQSALSARCMCSGKEMIQLVFRKTLDNHLVSYEKKERTETSPTMTLVMMDHVPTMAELHYVSHNTMFHSLNRRYKQPTLMCDPTFFDTSAIVLNSVDINSEPSAQVAEYYNDYYDDIEPLSLLTENESTTGTDHKSSTHAQYIESLALTLDEHGDTESISLWTKNESTTGTEYESSTRMTAHDDVESSPTPSEYYDYADYKLWAENESTTRTEYESSTRMTEHDDVESSATPSEYYDYADYKLWAENESTTETEYESSTRMTEHDDIESSPTPTEYYDYADYKLWAENESTTGTEYESSTHAKNEDIEISTSVVYGNVKSTSPRSANVSSSCAPLLNIGLVQFVLLFYIFN